MIKQQSNVSVELSNNLIKRKDKTNEHLTIRHDLVKSERSTRSIQETNINIFEKSSSHCSLIEISLKERVDKHLNKDQTKENLNKLQKITDEVKFLTKQLQLSVQLNKNNNSSSITLDERLISEICYQLERRILMLIFSSSKQFYGYSLRYLPLIIKQERNQSQRILYQKRFQHIEKYLSQASFHFDHHSILTFSLINQYGIYFDYQWLENHANLLSNLQTIKSFCYSIFSSNIHRDLEIILHSLELISKFDGKPLFYY